jgi:hypothetical protein
MAARAVAPWPADPQVLTPSSRQSEYLSEISSPLVESIELAAPTLTRTRMLRLEGWGGTAQRS